ncbi:MAG: hypothetical protein O7A09_04775 [Proteobacteria bacterium]|nr:hypothetical protein [Pseudomonadota bacterium]
MSQGASQRRLAEPFARVREGLEGLVQRAASRAASSAGKGADRVRGAAQQLARSTVFQHALAALERGNVQAAFWLMHEEWSDHPARLDVATAYWDAAVVLERIDVAAPAAVWLVEERARSGDLESAAQVWSELVSVAPNTLVAPTALALILPLLCRRVEEVGEDERHRAREHARRAMRHAVDSRTGPLATGVALRLFEEGRACNPEAARCAAERALESPDLHEAKRERLAAWLAGEEIETKSRREPEPPPAPVTVAVAAETPPPSRPAAQGSLSESEIARAAARLPEPTPTPAQTAPEEESSPELEIVDDTHPKLEIDPDDAGIQVTYAVPVALEDDGLRVRSDAGEIRIPWSEIEAVSVFQVGEKPVPIIDLVRHWRREGGEPLRVVRLRTDGFDPAALAPDPERVGPDGALASLLSEILDRTRAVPLPGPESALGLCVASFADLESYEREVLRRESRG